MKLARQLSCSEQDLGQLGLGIHVRAYIGFGWILYIWWRCRELNPGPNQKSDQTLQA